MIHIHVEPGKAALGKAAAELGAQAIRAAIASRNEANIVVATGASQFEMLSELVAKEDIDWSRVTAFHLDEYIGMPDTHPASFRRYLRERFATRVPKLAAMHYIDGDAADLNAELDRLNKLIAARPIDVAFAGIGENAHLAFNDPPADFEAKEPYRVVDLDERCRAQQLGEGWFGSLAEVPMQAISMSVQQIMASSLVVLSVPDRRKAEAVRNTVENPVSPEVPASILRRHAACHLFIDTESAALLRQIPSAVAE
ncbi:MAG TPA: glucosamine-6-phosphate deaminase [Devosiaceae bacterium]|nr:glucosamine-6-phosphate deaminase [Devosiaceae bacterium]